MRLSAIIPVHPSPARLAETLPRAIASVTAQTVPAFELIQMKGMSNTQARNAGAAQATGDWLGFLDDDDWWAPDAIETITRLIRPGIDCIAAMPIGMRRPKLDHAAQWRLILNHGCLTSCSGLFISADAFRSIRGFDPDLITSDIYDLLLRLHQSGRKTLHYTDRGMYHKELRRGDNLSRLKSGDALLAERDCLLQRAGVCI